MIYNTTLVDACRTLVVEPDKAGESMRVIAQGTRNSARPMAAYLPSSYWLNGSHTLRVCYGTFLTKTGQWRYDGNVPSHRSTRSKTKEAAPRELLPPVEES
jgi:hypothetical protein